MSKFGAYYARFTGMRNDLTGLPAWARVVFAIVLVPGIVLVVLSIAALVVSIVALLFVAVPLYTFLRAVTRSAGGAADLVEEREIVRGDVKRVDSVVREPDQNVPDEVDGE